MTSRRTLLLATLSLMAPPAFAAQGWRPLFDGRTTTGWTAVGAANWKVADGAVQADAGTGFLVSNETFGDFELRVEVWIDAKSNSGVFIRGADPKKIDAVDAYEVNLYDARPDPTYATGAIVNLAKAPIPLPKAGGRWNLMEIRAQGEVFDVWLNGVRTVMGARDAKRARGVIALQRDAEGVVKFRKVEIRPL